ncbi:MAG TPA: NAD(P)/FAD-dependent oxidoreductase, partial [Vicinamibacterales bacterium]
MIRCDALVVGGGPAGSTCAWLLRRAGWDVAVADRARFPRDKVCAGWLTPHVFAALELDPSEYRAAGLTLQEITAFRTGVIGGPLVETRYDRVVSYAIRRCEFDDFLLRRASVRVLENTQVKDIRRERDRWIVNDAIEAGVLIGAGGHFCPVARHMTGDDETAPVVAKEAEFLLPRDTGTASEIPELFFCRDLEGYAWSVRKGEYLNVGIGRRRREGFNAHVEAFVEFLQRKRVFDGATGVRWRGHAYLAAGAGRRRAVADAVLLVGDAAGLAYPESGEGIRPAVESGRLAAETLIAAGGRRSAADLGPYAAALAERHPPLRPFPAPLKPLTTAIGRGLLRSSTFTRHVLL